MKTLCQTRTRAQRCRLGITVREAVIAFPLLIILVLGTVEFVRSYSLHHAADSAAFEAARNLILPGANEREAIAQAEAVLERLGVYDAAIEVVAPQPLEAATTVTVHVSVPLRQNSWIPAFLRKDRSVVRACTLMTERTKAVQANVM